MTFPRKRWFPHKRSLLGGFTIFSKRTALQNTCDFSTFHSTPPNGGHTASIRGRTVRNNRPANSASFNYNNSKHIALCIPLTFGQSQLAFLPPPLPPEIELGDGFSHVGAEERHLAQQLVHRIQGFFHHRRFVVGQQVGRVQRQHFASTIQLTLGGRWKCLHCGRESPVPFSSSPPSAGEP